MSTDDLPFHIDAQRRFHVSMWKMSSYHRFTIWMLPLGEPFALERGEWDERLVRVGYVTDSNFHGDRAKARAAALGRLAKVGYKPGMTADETRALLSPNGLEA